MSDRVTWLLPVKNGMPYLPQTLASIATQTYQHWEILAWDNGSTDGTLEVLQEWIPARLPGRIVRDRPLSLGDCLAEMVRQAETELCARIDADDINLPERLAKQVAYLQQHPEIAVLGSQVHRIDDQGTDYGLWLRKPLHPADIVHFLMRDCVLWHPSVLLRRSQVLAVGNYQDVWIDGVRSPTEDYDLWLRLAARYPLANLPDPLLHYRVHRASITQTMDTHPAQLQAADACFCRHAPRLYGCAATDARLLREWRHPEPVRVLKQIAAYLETHQPDQVGDRLHTESFMQAGRQLMSTKDLRACLTWALLNRNKTALPQELMTVAKNSLKVFGPQPLPHP